MATACAAVFDRAGDPFRFVELALPDGLNDGEMLVRISLATICGSDLHTYAGRRQEPTPCVLGHEGVGTVLAAGAGGARWIGRRISWTLAGSCGKCRPCVEFDLPQKCVRLFKYGHAALTDGTGLNGCYASHIVLRRGTHVINVPEEMSDAVAAPANCALATMVAATEQLPRPCHTAVVQGAGLLGIYGCALLRAKGVRQVIVVDTEPARLELASRFGGDPVLSSALNCLDAGGADFVVEASGNPVVVAEGVRLLRPGGDYVFVGMVHPDSALGLTGEAVVRGCLTLRGIHNYGPRHLEAAFAFLEKNASLPWASLVSPPLRLRRLDEAFALAASKLWARAAVRADE